MGNISTPKEYGTVMSKWEENHCIAAAGIGISTLTCNTPFACHFRDVRQSKATGNYILI